MESELGVGDGGTGPRKDKQMVQKLEEARGRPGKCKQFRLVGLQKGEGRGVSREPSDRGFSVSIRFSSPE